MSGLADKPLLTCAVAAFNQERFIREAVEGVLAQTYSPLEVILSDDCSKDRTFEIMREMAQDYRGPHRVILNRNPLQRSIGGHLNRIAELAQGELILAAAGDDISLPERTQVVYEAWEFSGRRATSIHSSIIQIDEDGARIGEVFKGETSAKGARFVKQQVDPLAYVQTLEPLIYGCAHAFSPGLFRDFGKLPEEVIHEDNALGFRSILAGELVFINEPLVKYRVHGSNVSIRITRRTSDLSVLERQEERVHRGYRNRETMYRGFQSDLEVARKRGILDERVSRNIAREAAQRERRMAEMWKFLDSGFWDKCRILRKLHSEGLAGDQFKSLFHRLPPRSLYLLLRALRDYASLLSKPPQQGRSRG